MKNSTARAREAELLKASEDHLAEIQRLKRHNEELEKLNREYNERWQEEMKKTIETERKRSRLGRVLRVIRDVINLELPHGGSICGPPIGLLVAGALLPLLMLTRSA